MSVDTRHQAMLAELLELRASKAAPLPVRENATTMSEPLDDRGRRSEPAGEDVDRELLQAKLEASEAKTEAKFADLRSDLAAMRGDMAAFRGEVQGLRAAIDSKPSRMDLLAAVLAIVGLIVATIFSIASLSGDKFALGVSLADKRQEQLQVDAAQNRTSGEINSKLDQLLAAERPNPGAPPADRVSRR